MEGWPKAIILIDADAFFAAVEMRDHPEYRGKPLIVGAMPGTRGVVATCSYEARKYGVRSAMPISQAYRLCPQGIYVTPDFRKYKEASEKMFAICERYTPLVERVSIDEGYLDVTPLDGAKTAAKIREDVRTEVGVTVTAGVSYCKFLAKLAAERNKPDGLGVVDPRSAMDFLSGLPVGDLPGVGPKTLRLLQDHGIRTVGDLRSMPDTWFESILGKYGRRLKDLSEGRDPSPVETTRQVKSISEETTFQVDQTDPALLHAVLAHLSQDVGFRLRREGLSAKTIGIKVRFSDFSTLTRELTVDVPVSSDREIFACGKRLLDRLRMTLPVRLLGVSASGLSAETKEQRSLFEEDSASWQEVSKAVDALRAKYGKNLVNLGATLHRQINPSEESKY